MSHDDLQERSDAEGELYARVQSLQQTVDDLTVTVFALLKFHPLQPISSGRVESSPVAAVTEPGTWRISHCGKVLMSPNKSVVGLWPSEYALLRIFLDRPEGLSGARTGHAASSTDLPLEEGTTDYEQWRETVNRLRRKVRRRCGLPLPVKLVGRDYYRFDGTVAYID